MSWSGRPLALESGLLESELASGGLLWCLFSQPLSAPPPTSSCPLSAFALNPAPSQFLWSDPPTAWTNGRAEEACEREGMGWESLHTSGQHCSNPELQAVALGFLSP